MGVKATLELNKALLQIAHISSGRKASSLGMGYNRVGRPRRWSRARGREAGGSRGRARGGSRDDGRIRKRGG